MRCRRTFIAAVLLVILAVPGCAGWKWPATPEAKLLAAREVFNVTVNALAAAIEHGEFTDEEAKHILQIARLGQNALNRYDAAIDLGQPTSSLLREFNTLLREIVSYQKELERRRKNGST